MYAYTFSGGESTNAAFSNLQKETTNAEATTPPVILTNEGTPTIESQSYTSEPNTLEQDTTVSTDIGPGTTGQNKYRECEQESSSFFGFQGTRQVKHSIDTAGGTSINQC